jgi:diaminopimelate epimerase
MKTRFAKFHGTGNDFILIDTREQTFTPDPGLVALWCDRHKGIGGDGLILLSAIEGYDFSMTYFNSDGRESTMCGNGGRCIAAFAHHLGIISEETVFSDMDGPHTARVLSAEAPMFIVTVKLRDTRVETSTPTGTFVQTGSPHLVRFVADVESMDVVKEGRRIRYGKKYAAEGINVDFVEPIKDTLKVRTYERGVENETLSCGTGVTAAALVSASKFEPARGYYLVSTPGGKLKVSFTRNRDEFTDIWLEGEARFVFEGAAEF